MYKWHKFGFCRKNICWGNLTLQIFSNSWCVSLYTFRDSGCGGNTRGREVSFYFSQSSGYYFPALAEFITLERLGPHTLFETINLSTILYTTIREGLFETTSANKLMKLKFHQTQNIAQCSVQMDIANRPNSKIYIYSLIN